MRMQKEAEAKNQPSKDAGYRHLRVLYVARSMCTYICSFVVSSTLLSCMHDGWQSSREKEEKSLDCCLSCLKYTSGYSLPSLSRDSSTLALRDATWRRTQSLKYQSELSELPEELTLVSSEIFSYYCKL